MWSSVSPWLKTVAAMSLDGDTGSGTDISPGQAVVQVEPMKPTLKAPGTRRSKLQYDGLP